MASAHRATVYRWLADGAPRRPDGTWDVDEVEAWAAERKLLKAQRSADIRHGTRAADSPGEPAPAPGTSAAGAGPNAARTLTDARIQETRIRTAERAFALQQRQGMFVERAKVADMLTARMATLRRRMTAAGRQIGLELAAETGADPLRCQDLVTQHLHAILREIYGRPADVD